MKFLHLSDLHLGKRVSEFSMIPDQEHILRQILGIIDAEKPQAVVIAGDVYDKSVPSAEAVRLFDFFLTALSARRLAVMIIAGNHDSPERLSFGEKLFKLGGVHISPVYDGQISPVVSEDDFGCVNFWLLPFLRPSQVRSALLRDDIETYTEACSAAIENLNIDHAARNVLICHQFVTGSLRSESEEISVGGSDNVDAEVFSGFDYVALGHLHSPQNVGSERLRYCGTPLKYSFSECSHEKSVTVVEMLEKGNMKIKTVPLKPLHDMREIKGTYSDLTLKKNYENTATDDYLHIILTDSDDVPDAIGRLRTVYPNIMKLSYDNERTRGEAFIPDGEAKAETPYELFGEFFERQNGRKMSPDQEKIVTDLIEKIWSER